MLSKKYEKMAGAGKNKTILQKFYVIGRGVATP